jgi:hypothetical protein
VRQVPQSTPAESWHEECSAFERQRRVVQHDPDGAIGLLHERPGLIDGGGFAGAIHKTNVAHGGGITPVELNHLIDHLTGAPGLEGKTLVVREGGIAPNEIGQSSSAGGAERLRSRGECWLERHRSVLIGIGLINHRLSRGLGLAETTTGVSGADLEQCVAPSLLSSHHLGLGEIAIQHLHRWRGVTLEAQPQRESGSDLEQTGTQHGLVAALLTICASPPIPTSQARRNLTQPC